jgi:hypothetical protein
MFRRLNHVAIPGYAPLCMDSNDPETVSHAFECRVLRDVPEPPPGALKGFSEFVAKFLEEHVPAADPYTFEEWLALTSYNEDRKKQLRASYDYCHGQPPTKHQARHVDSFVKSESYPCWKPARIINSRCDAFKVFSGPRFKAVEDVVYALPEFIKHTPVPDRPMLIRQLKQAGRRYYQTDFTAFESHFTPEVMEACELQLYRHVLRNDKHVDFMCSVISGKNCMRTRTGTFVSVQGRRMSGDMCTSLGNGFTNLMLAKYIVSLKHGTLTGFVEGDDGLFSTDVTLTPSDYANLGFSIKIEEVDDPCEASFCGMVFSESGQIIRDPRRFFEGFGWTTSFINAGGRIMDELLRAKALSTCYETPQCPVVGALARYALKKTSHVHPRFVADGYHVLPDIVNVPAFSPSLDTRLLFEREYGVSLLAQIAMEKAIGRGDMEAVSFYLPPSADIFDYASKYLIVT